MDSRDGKKKKESIDDILSDLNGLLNKMPSILDGIRMPEPQPAERAPEPARDEVKIQPPAADAEKTVVLPPFTGLPEGAPAPEPATPAFDAEKTVVLQSFSGLPEGADVPEVKAEEQAAPPAEGKLELQSLGDFMFGAGADQNTQAPQAEVPAVPQAAELPAETVSPAPAEAGLNPAEEMKPEFPPEAEPQRPGPESFFSGLPAESADPIKLAPLGLPEAEPSSRQYDTTRDFGIPDIDALMQLSDAGSGQPAAESAPQAEAPAQEQPAEVQATEQEEAPLAQASLSPAADPGEPVPTGDELAEFEEQLKAAAPQGDIVENNNQEEEKKEIPLQDEAQQAPAAGPEAFIIEPAASKPTGFEAFTIEPSSEEDAPAQDAGETLRLEPAPEAVQAETPQPEPAIAGIEELSLGVQPDQAGETLQAQPAAEPVITGIEELSLGVQPDQAGETLQVQPAAEPAIETGAGISLNSAAEPALQDGSVELTVGSQGEGTQQFQAPAAGPSSPQGIELEPASAMFSGQPASGPSGDETLVIAPPSGASGDDEKTVIFQAGQIPGVTSRSQAGDLAGLSERPVPEGIPAERVKGLVFLYSPDDKALCATVMAELDAICLKSASKPMFVKRSSVRECDLDLNANVALQMVTDTGATGLICVGAVPQEKVYELENTFSGANGFFRYYDSSSFNHTAALDLVSDLILR